MTRLILALLVATLASAPIVGHAQSSTPEQRAAAKQKWESMSPEEKAAAKAKAKAKWDSMSPEEQAAAKKRFALKHPEAAKKMGNASEAAASAAK